jgi:hypothetical protein
MLGRFNSEIDLFAQSNLILNPGTTVVTAAHDAFEIADVVAVIVQISQPKFHRMPVGFEMIGAPTGQANAFGSDTM